MAKTYTKSKVSHLQLVFPPISAQEAYYAKDNPEAEARLRRSDFYMIVARAEAKFVDVTVSDDETELSVSIAVGGQIVDSGTIKVEEIPNVAKFEGQYGVAVKDKEIVVVDLNPGREGLIIEGFTPDSLMFARSRGVDGVLGFNQRQAVATYDLLYVGIAKVGDTFDRLIAKGHEKRQAILSNEPQRANGARVADEVFLLCFEVEPLVFTTYELDHEFTEADYFPTYDNKALICDAEKAFVKLLDPKYNVQKFANYPKGRDGLYGSDYDRYSYALAETITLKAGDRTFRGSRDPNMGLAVDGGDFIQVEGDDVTLFQNSDDAD